LKHKRYFECAIDCRHYDGYDGCKSSAIDSLIDRMIVEDIEFKDATIMEQDEETKYPLCPLYCRQTDSSKSKP